MAHQESRGFSSRVSRVPGSRTCDRTPGTGTERAGDTKNDRAGLPHDSRTNSFSVTRSPECRQVEPVPTGGGKPNVYGHFVSRATLGSLRGGDGKLVPETIRFRLLVRVLSSRFCRGTRSHGVFGRPRMPRTIYGSRLPKRSIRSYEPRRQAAQGGPVDAEGLVHQRLTSPVIESATAWKLPHPITDGSPSDPSVALTGAELAHRFALLQPGHAVARFREPDKHLRIVARDDETRIRRDLLHAILRRQV